MEGHYESTIDLGKMTTVNAWYCCKHISQTGTICLQSWKRRVKIKSAEAEIFWLLVNSICQIFPLMEPKLLFDSPFLSSKCQHSSNYTLGECNSVTFKLLSMCTVTEFPFNFANVWPKLICCNKKKKGRNTKNQKQCVSQLTWGCGNNSNLSLR